MVFSATALGVALALRRILSLRVFHETSGVVTSPARVRAPRIMLTPPG